MGVMQVSAVCAVVLLCLSSSALARPTLQSIATHLRDSAKTAEVKAQFPDVFKGLRTHEEGSIEDPAAWATVDARFNAWATKYAKTFKNSQDRAERLANFAAFAARVDAQNAKFNAGESTWTAKFSKLADLNKKEFEAKNGFKVPEDYVRAPAMKMDLPKSTKFYADTIVDWTARGAVTDVKDQGQCGSCWAFSTTGALEGAAFINAGKLISLSEQEILDCGRNENMQGCDGGDMGTAMQWIINNTGIDTEDDYQYASDYGSDEQCDYQKQTVKFVTMKSYLTVPPSNEVAMLTAITKQPVSIAVAASDDWQTYAGGTFMGYCSDAEEDLNHGVLVTGYNVGKDGLSGFYQIKNSWGEDWGDDGYISLYFSQKDVNGPCGMYWEGNIPVGAAEPPVAPAPPPPPKCSSGTYCNYGNTCCCHEEVFSICTKWDCCNSKQTCTPTKSHFLGLTKGNSCT